MVFLPSHSIRIKILLVFLCSTLFIAASLTYASYRIMLARMTATTTQDLVISMSLRFSEQHQLISDLHGALTNEEPELHYQPFIEISSGKIIGKEALLRWRHPKLGLIPS